ncbi:sensor domain-containing diguanylate cyclase [Marinomonas algicola]|uniref:sensor domain-containing diguanylate cyclase n=1 Tax=Marinomonas algicola TaxID=2773454 RepID=UPI00174A880D|nr:sensor domain-containing diguanylate cyclase [Marinomonas algicola]
MQPPEKPCNETGRLQALRALKILDSSHEERFDRVTRMAKQMFAVPITSVTLIDENRQWFKSSQGLDILETPRDISFCGHAINQEDLFIVADTLKDERFFDNPFVIGAPHVRFYAGYPLKLRPGIFLGTLCILDTKPRIFSDAEKCLLNDFGAMIEQEIRSMQWATFDELTMIYSRRGFFTLAEHTHKLCVRKSMSIAFIFFDLDAFKPINDTYGHQQGDSVLVQFAEALQQSFRESDIIGRLGGDEFIVMLSDTDITEVNSLLNKFTQTVHRLNLDKPYLIKFSSGVSYFTCVDNLLLDDMIEQADVAMYHQKASKKVTR